jgi:hypothetical protein
MRDKYIIPGSLEHANHQLRFFKKRCKKTDGEVGRGYAKWKESQSRLRKLRSDTHPKTPTS